MMVSRVEYLVFLVEDVWKEGMSCVVLEVIAITITILYLCFQSQYICLSALETVCKQVPIVLDKMFNFFTLIYNSECVE